MYRGLLLKLVCIHCGNAFEGNNEKFCSQACQDTHVVTIEKKTMTQILEEEKEKLLSEVNQKVKKRKALMNPDTNYDLKHEFKNKS